MTIIFKEALRKKDEKLHYSGILFIQWCQGRCSFDNNFGKIPKDYDISPKNKLNGILKNVLSPLTVFTRYADVGVS